MHSVVTSKTLIAVYRMSFRIVLRQRSSVTVLCAAHSPRRTAAKMTMTNAAV